MERRWGLKASPCHPSSLTSALSLGPAHSQEVAQIWPDAAVRGARYYDADGTTSGADAGPPWQTAHSDRTLQSEQRQFVRCRHCNPIQACRALRIVTSDTKSRWICARAAWPALSALSAEHIFVAALQHNCCTALAASPDLGTRRAAQQAAQPDYRMFSTPRQVCLHCLEDPPLPAIDLCTSNCVCWAQAPCSAAAAQQVGWGIKKWLVGRSRELVRRAGCLK